MIDKIAFKKTLVRFKREANVLLQSDWSESPRPFKRFLGIVDAEPVIKAYLDECVENHTPEGFDAAKDVREVANNLNLTFTNFSTIPDEESAQVFLILKEMIEQNVQGRSNFYYSFAYGDKYSEMYKGFLNRIVRRLINNIEEHLILIGIEMGLDGGDVATTNFNGPVGNLQINQAIGKAAISAVQNNSIDESTLRSILDNLLAAADAEIDNAEAIEDIRDNVEAVRIQIESGKPKRGVLKSALGFLRGVSGGTQFSAAVVQLIEFFGNSGFQFLLPS